MPKGKDEQIRCYGCEGYHTVTYGYYKPMREFNNRLKKDEIDEDEVMGNLDISTIDSYKDLNRYQCLNINCDIKSFYYCKHEKSSEDGLYYYVPINRFVNYYTARALYLEIGVIQTLKSVSDEMKRDYTYKLLLKDKDKRRNNKITKHINKISELNKRRKEYQTKLTKIKTELKLIVSQLKILQKK